MYILYYFNGWKLAGGCKNNPHRPDQNTPPQGKPAMTKDGMDQLHVLARLPTTRKAKPCLKGDVSQPDIYMYINTQNAYRKRTHTHLDHEIINIR